MNGKIKLPFILMLIAMMWVLGFLKPIGFSSPFVQSSQAVVQPTETQPTQTTQEKPVWEVLSTSTEQIQSPPSVTSESVQWEIAFYIIMIVATIVLYFAIKNYEILIQ